MLTQSSFPSRDEIKKLPVIKPKDLGNLRKLGTSPSRALLSSADLIALIDAIMHLKITPRYLK